MKRDSRRYNRLRCGESKAGSWGREEYDFVDWQPFCVAGFHIQQVEIAALRVAMAVRVPAVVPCVGPLAVGTRVYVNKLALRVVANAAGMEGKRSVPQFDGWNAGNP